MPFDVKVIRTPDYVRFNVIGPSSLPNFAALVPLISSEIEQFEDLRVLIDLRRVVGRLSTEAQILVGEMAAQRAQLLFKMASLVPPGEFTGNSERAAIKQGLQLRVFISEASALAWLLEAEPD
jgi:hypothetical protein